LNESERQALIRSTLVAAGHQIGWFDPGSKRFAYTDEKDWRPDRHKSYTVPVYAIPFPPSEVSGE
jgi:hypothetical protein